MTNQVHDNVFSVRSFLQVVTNQQPHRTRDSLASLGAAQLRAKWTISVDWLQSSQHLKLCSRLAFMSTACPPLLPLRIHSSTQQHTPQTTFGLTALQNRMRDLVSALQRVAECLPLNALQTWQEAQIFTVLLRSQEANAPFKGVLPTSRHKQLFTIFFLSPASPKQYSAV